MRDARASASVASASKAQARAKNREKIVKNRENREKIAKRSRKNAKNREIANGTRLLAHRSRSLRSRSLAHREKYRCAGTIFSFLFLLLKWVLGGDLDLRNTSLEHGLRFYRSEADCAHCGSSQPAPAPRPTPRPTPGHLSLLGLTNKIRIIILRDFSRCTPVFFAMRERARA